MLQFHEPNRAIGFPEGHQFVGTREDVVKKIGVAVEKHVAKALPKVVLQVLVEVRR